MRSIPQLILVWALSLSTPPLSWCYHQRSNRSTKPTTRATTRNPNLNKWEEDVVDDVMQPRSRKRFFLPKVLRKENRWDVVELVRLRGGSEEVHPLNSLDRTLRSFSFWLGGIVACQSALTMCIYSSDDGLVQEIAKRLLSPESAVAVKTIRKIINQFKDHGVIDVFKDYPAKDVVMAIIALGKLQTATARYMELHEPHNGNPVDPLLLQQLAQYSIFANAAYGWTLEVALRGRLHMGDLQALLKKTGVKPDDVVAAEWESRTHRPSYFIVRDTIHKKLVLAIRGTLSARDVLTDLCATGESFETGRKGKHRAHHGMLESARGVAKETRDIVRTELETHPDYSLVIVGHSLGGGVAAVLGTLWECDYPDLMVYGYGTPCVGPIDARPTTSANVISVVGEGDPFSSLSLGHIADVSKALALLCEDAELRSMILMRTDGAVGRMETQDLQWCKRTMENLREKFIGERMYPPGRILFIERDDKNIASLREVSPTRFADLRLHARMLDVSRHVPSLYECLLQEMALN